MSEDDDFRLNNTYMEHGSPRCPKCMLLEILNCELTYYDIEFEVNIREIK